MAIASSTSKKIGVLAGPGTGKTTYGLIRRVARLLSEGVSGKKILLLSFTRTAAADLKSKVADLNVSGVEDVQAMTLHSFCYQLLKKDAVFTATQRVPRTLLAHEVDLMLRDLDGNFGDLDSRRKQLEAFEAGWVRQTNDHPGLASLPSDRAFETEVLKWLRHHKAMLIGEVVPLAYKYLKDNPEAEELHTFSHIIVDEYQDLNRLEQHLLDLIREADDIDICVAGDDDQSIYGFRHANPIGILEYQERPDTEKYDITTCGRCPKTVLAMANALISNAPNHIKSSLVSNHPEEGNVAIVQWQDLNSEIEGTVSAIITDITTGRRNAGDILVLTHRSKIGTEIRRKLQEQAIQVHSFFNEEAVISDPSREALALLELICGNDKVAVRVLLGSGDSTGRREAYNRLSNYALQNNITEIEVLDQLSQGSKITGLSIPALISRYKNASIRATHLRGLNLEQLIDELLPEDNTELSDLRQLAREALPISTDCQDLLKNITLSITQVDVPQHPDFVRIMSLHKSKGLTSPAVFIVGFVEGIIPTIKNNATEEERTLAIEEQRRLFYVALTRTSNQLVISSSIGIELPVARRLGVAIQDGSTKYIGGKLVAKTIASTYLGELGSQRPGAIRGVTWISSY
ncbi:ATP-dependent helicase [Candidatus Daviesbacteria bacterium]|nr:ATP-dependent helicase [Candidatus Daviesbacteria bacterium]